MMSPLPPAFALNSTFSMRQWLAPGAVRSAGDWFGLLRTASVPLCSGPTRVPDAGSLGESVRTVMKAAASAFDRSTKLPTNSAPGCSSTVSPGVARSSAACRS
jgi:hypothetical protein